jgi:transcriptional regulator with XRE-family HTH domain
MQRTLVTVGYRQRRERRERRSPNRLRSGTVLRMRDKALGGTWASYVRAAREHTGLTRAQLARAANVGRATVYRWEAGEQRPEQAEIVLRVARVTGVDLDEALAAAGLRPGHHAPETPRRQELPIDPDVRLLLEQLADPDVPEEHKQLIRGQLRYLADLADRIRERR